MRNSEGAEGEPAIFHQPARWVDYSGYIAPGVIEGLTLFDHPLNPYHPSPFHVREDGWMGAMLSTDRATTVAPGRSLHLRYGVYVHAGMPEGAQIEGRWKEFAGLNLHPPYGPPKNGRDCLNGSHRLFQRAASVPEFEGMPGCCPVIAVRCAAGFWAAVCNAPAQEWLYQGRRNRHAVSAAPSNLLCSGGPEGPLLL